MVNRINTIPPITVVEVPVPPKKRSSIKVYVNKDKVFVEKPVVVITRR